MNNFPIGDLPFPGTPWLFLAVLLGIFLLHFIAVWILVGTLSLGIYSLHTDKIDLVNNKTIKSLPIIMAFVVNLGIPPLLALQVLYSPQIYSSSILIAVPWISVFMLALMAYFAIYAARYSAKTNMQAGILLKISTIAILLVSFIYSNNMTLMIRPDLWQNLYTYSSDKISMGAQIYRILWIAVPTSMLIFSIWKKSWWYFLASIFLSLISCAVINTLFYSNGFNLYPNLPEVTARWLWLLAPSFVAGLSFLKRSPKWAIISSVLGICALFYYKGFLPAHIIQQNNVMPLLINADFILSSLILVFSFFADGTKQYTYCTFWTWLLLKGIVVVALRHAIRTAYLDPVYPLNAIPVHSQWILIVIFVLSVLIALGTMFWMFKKGGKDLVL